MHNVEVAEIFDRLADTLEIAGANPFRVRAYRNAARVIQTLGREVVEMIRQGEDLTELPGIGKDLAAKIEEIVRTGALKALGEAERQVPKGVLQLMRVPSLGPKRIAILHEKLGIRSLEDLERAAVGERVRKLRGFGEKTEARYLEEIRRLSTAGPGRRTLQRVEPTTLAILDHLKRAPGIGEVVIAGSYRRARETVGDLDYIVTCRNGGPVLNHFVRYPAVDRVISKGETRATVALRDGLQVDLRVVPEKSFGAALHYFTGSKDHNIAIRTMGIRLGLKINEYGVFRGRRQIGGRTEEEVYAAVGLPYIDPELREMRGEIEAAAERKLPRLIRVEDIQGDLHSHTDETDGRATLEEMIEGAIARGHRYLAISDHTHSLAMTGGLDARRLSLQGRAIDRANRRYGDRIRVLKSSEVDILADGDLDFPDSVLSRLDLTTCSVHSRFALPSARQTERILRAMRNPYCTILGHPSGRLIGRRAPYDADMEQILRAAADLGVLLEVNAQPERLDLTDTYCKAAKKLGARFVISTDAHGPEEFGFLKYGVGQARRGWLEPRDVANSWPVDELLAYISEQRDRRLGRRAVA